MMIYMVKFTTFSQGDSNKITSMNFYLYQDSQLNSWSN